MNNKDLEILHKLKSLLNERVKLHKVVLFGSRARGNADSESDMDVLVLLNEPITTEVRDIVSDCTWKAGFNDGIVLSSILYSIDEWEDGPEYYSPFAEAVRLEGIPI